MYNVMYNIINCTSYGLQLLYPLRIQSPSYTDQPTDSNCLFDMETCRTDHGQGAVEFQLEIPLFRISSSPMITEDSGDGFIQFQAIESVEADSKILKDGCWVILHCKRHGVSEHPRGAIFYCFHGNPYCYHGNSKILLPWGVQLHHIFYSVVHCL